MRGVAVKRLVPCRLSTVELFCKAAETRSFTAAAETLGSTPSAVSKAVSRLENRLGVKLFQRTTRAIRLTEDGSAYYETCRQALSQIEEVEVALTRGQTNPRGTLRLSLPVTYGLKRVVPLIPRYVERYRGQVNVEVNLSNEIKDFIAEGFDLSVRLGKVSDSRLVARALHDANLCVVGAPDYVRRHGLPKTPDDLLKHRCVALTLPDTGRPIPWVFSDRGETWETKPPGSLSFDDPMAALTAALNGAGFVRLLDFTVENEVRAGRLVEVLADYRPPPQSVSAVYPYNRHLSAKVRTFVDFLVDSARETSTLHHAELAV